MRIVVDTNVIASAVYFGGKPYDLLKLIMEEKVSAIASKEIVDEYEEILARLQHKFPKLSKSIPFQVHSLSGDCGKTYRNQSIFRHSHMQGFGG